MKLQKLLLLFIFLLLPLGTYAHWEEDADDDDPAFGTDENPIELDEIVCTPDYDDFDDWYNDDYWYNNDYEEDDIYENDEYMPSLKGTSNGNSGTSNNISGNQGEDNDSKVSKDSLEMAAKKVLEKIIRKYGSSQAVCNIGVNAMFEYLFGSNALNGMRANEIVRYWMSHPSQWQRISMSEAQALANKGYFVVAGWINPTGRSGHVVVVVPGTAVYRSNWGGYIPNVMDTGEEKRTVKQLLSNSFNSAKRNDIVFFKYKK